MTTLTTSWIYSNRHTTKRSDNMICPACNSENDKGEEYCLKCGQRLIESDEPEKVKENKLTIPTDKIILLDLNYTLISNSWAIRFEKLPGKINKRKYEHELIDLIKNNYIILITASPYYTSYDSLRHIEENTDLKIDESYWNFGKRPHELKEYWLKKAVLPTHGDDSERYLAIESNERTREMYSRFGIEARPKGDFI